MLGGRVKTHTLVLGVAAVLVCARAAMPSAAGTAALTAASSTRMVDGSVPVMVSISGPMDVHSSQPAALGTAVHLAADGEAINGATVVLERRGDTAKTWEEAARSMTDNRGRAVFMIPVQGSTQFRARSLGDPHYAAASSAVITVAER